MKHLVDLEKLDRLDNLIRRKATGCPDELADRLEMSRSTLFEFISFLRDVMEAPIHYNKFIQSYTYKYPTKFHLNFEREKLNETMMYAVQGGDESSDNDLVLCQR